MISRSGFVSNSSTSSFIVRIREDFCPEPEVFLTQEEVQLLKDYGFKYTWKRQPIEVEYGGDGHVAGETDTLVFHVACNQDYVIYFLLKHNIPFEALCHYGHESMFYKRGEKTVLKIENPGLEYNIYSGFIPRLRRRKIISKIRKSCWLKDKSLEDEEIIF